MPIHIPWEKIALWSSLIWNQKRSLDHAGTWGLDAIGCDYDVSAGWWSQMFQSCLSCFNHVSIVYLGEDNPTETTIPVQICMHWKHQSDYIYIYFLCSPGARVFCPWPQIHPSLWWNPLLHGYHYSLVCTILISHCIGSKDVTSVTSFCISPINVAVKAQKKRVL